MSSLHQGRKEGNVLFNDTRNTFYLKLYGVRHMVKDHTDSERGNPLPPHRLLFPISSKGYLYAPSHRQDSTYHGLCYTSRGALAGTRNSSSLHQGYKIKTNKNKQKQTKTKKQPTTKMTNAFYITTRTPIGLSV